MRVVPLLVATALLATPAPAHAFCRSTTCVGDCPRDADGCKTTGAPLHWDSLCVGLALDRQASEHVAFDALHDSALRSIASWSSLSCPQGEATIAFVEQGPVSCHVATFDPGGPNANVILFQDDHWDHPASEHALAKTTVTFDPFTGSILDADIELNEVSADFTTLDDGVVIDLESVLTHELGHLIGLDHSLDFAATMNAAYVPGSVDLRSLELDDIAGACTIYPPHRDAVCRPIPRGGLAERCGDALSDGGCSVAAAPRADDVPPLLLVVAAAGLGAVRRSGLRRAHASR